MGYTVKIPYRDRIFSRTEDGAYFLSRKRLIQKNYEFEKNKLSTNVEYFQPKK